MVSEMENDLTANLESRPLKYHLLETSQTYLMHDQRSKRAMMTIPKKSFISLALRNFSAAPCHLRPPTQASKRIHLKEARSSSG